QTEATQHRLRPARESLLLARLEGADQPAAWPSPRASLPSCYTASACERDACQMFHHRLTLTGSDDCLTAAGAELLAMGAVPVGEWCFTTSQGEDAEMWRKFAENHSSVRLSRDLFHEFQVECVHAIVMGRALSS